MATQMTRAEYERLYGVKPVFSATSTLEDEAPAPIRMTREEYNQTYYPQGTQTDTLGSKLVGRAKDVGDALIADKPSDLIPGRSMLRIGGAVTGAAADVIGAAISPALNKLTETISNIPAVQRFAIKQGTQKALDVANTAVDLTQEEWRKFEEKNPEVAQDIRDVTNIASFIPVGKGASVAGKGVARTLEPVATKLDDRGVKSVVDEIAKIEDKYATTRKANQYSKDIDASRRRIAESNVLDGSVDADGVIRTKTPGGVIDQYKAQTIDKYEDLVRRGLTESKETIPVAEVRRMLIREVGTSGLEGADLVTALRKVEKELEGLNARIKGSSIVDLRYLHDNKIATTKNINYLTPPEKATYRKAVARAYKILVEENSKKVDVKGINERLGMYYDDIARLERLDGARAEGGRLGKYTASLAGTLIGGAAGSVGGGVGAAIGGVIGGEAAQALKGLGMSRTFKGGGKGLAKDAVLEKARLSIPDKPIRVKAGIKKTKEITELEGKIAKNVADQKKAIAKGDFALVAALKEVYQVLVEELKKAIKYLNENASVGLAIKDVTKNLHPDDAKLLEDFIDSTRIGKPLSKNTEKELVYLMEKLGIDPNTNATVIANKMERILQSYNRGSRKTTYQAKNTMAKSVIDDTIPQSTAKTTSGVDNLMEEAKKYPTPEEFVANTEILKLNKDEMVLFRGQSDNTYENNKFFAGDYEHAKNYADEDASDTVIGTVVNKKDIFEVNDKSFEKIADFYRKKFSDKWSLEDYVKEKYEPIIEEGRLNNAMYNGGRNADDVADFVAGALFRKGTDYSSIARSGDTNDLLMPMFEEYARANNKNIISFRGSDYSLYGEGKIEYLVLDISKYQKLHDIWKKANEK